MDNSIPKGLERLRLIGSAVAGCNHARTITKTSSMNLDTIQDDYDNRICSTGSLVNKPVGLDSLDASYTLKGQVVFDFSNITQLQTLFDIL